MALLANGYVVSKPSTAEPHDLLATDPLSGETVKIQVKTIQIRTDRGGEYVVHARKSDGTPYTKSDADYLIGVLVGEGEFPRVFMFENREIREYWASEARASKRWVELSIALDRAAYTAEGVITTQMEAVI
ncbi:hypothetical protein MHZ92_14520 [Sporosarcina sp. ACRSL]|nr:hypothetical protein [Sporosarcina sp. ACRSL]MCG7345350.1 hypothetical protein [Sporosarcina sp. ACRSL]